MKRRKVLKSLVWSAMTTPALAAYSPMTRSDRIGKMEMISFLSQWHLLPDMIWTGSDYWANHLRDWKIHRGKLRCITTGQNRNIQLLTHSLRGKGNFLQSSIQLKGNPNVRDNEGIIGFLWGIRGKYQDYRSACTTGTGIAAGINHDGYLVLGDLISYNKLDLEMLHEGVDLKLFINHGGDRVRSELSVWHRGQPMVTLQRHDISPDQLPGNIGLMADFEKEDLSQWSAEFAHWELRGDLLDHHPGQAYGPIYFAQHTLENNILKLTAQLAPADLSDQRVVLRIRKNEGSWEEKSVVRIHPEARIAHFEIEDWDSSQYFDYQLSTELKLMNGAVEEYEYRGSIPAEPLGSAELTAIAFSGMNHLDFSEINFHEKIYKHDANVALFFVSQTEASHESEEVSYSQDNGVLNYLHDWILFGWTYRDIFKELPSICIAGDGIHSRVEGNDLERREENPSEPQEKDETYFSAEEHKTDRLNQVIILTQISHMPNRVRKDDDPPAFWTQWKYAGVDFGILNEVNSLSGAERDSNSMAQEKDGNDQKISDEHLADMDDQIGILEKWIEDWKEETEIKVLLSQASFRISSTPQENSEVSEPDPASRQGAETEDEKRIYPRDTIGARAGGVYDDMIRTLRKAYVVHLSGSQNPPSIVQYGMENYGDSNFVFTVPSQSMSRPMRWNPMPGVHRPILGRKSYTGDFEDENGKKMTVFSVANPLQKEEAEGFSHSVSGYGIVRFDKKTRRIRFECWPISSDLSRDEQEQFDDWPFEMDQQDNFASRSDCYLPPIMIEGLEHPIIRILKREGEELVSILKIRTSMLPYAARVEHPGEYLVAVQSADGKIKKSMDVSTDMEEVVIFRF